MATLKLSWFKSSDTLIVEKNHVAERKNHKKIINYTLKLLLGINKHVYDADLGKNRISKSSYFSS